jgi:hypothetical protein
MRHQVFTVTEAADPAGLSPAAIARLRAANHRAAARGQAVLRDAAHRS